MPSAVTSMLRTTEKLAGECFETCRLCAWVAAIFTVLTNSPRCRDDHTSAGTSSSH